MYRQILVDERDTPLQRIIWRNSPEDPLDTYELKTVTYGTASAPFLATRVLQKLADDEQNNFPEAASVLRKDFYVDDLFSGSSTETDAITLRNELETILARGGFQLRKWASNKPAVLADIPIEDRAIQQSVDLDRDQCIKTLGIHWEPTTDILKYNVKLPKPDSTVALTKRIALSYIAQLFDPLGLVGPVVTTAKLFMQALWTLKDEHGSIWSWDRELPSTLQNRWTVYHTQLPLLNQLNINRFALCLNWASVQLHLFSDASELAYGACAYLRSENSAGHVNVALLTAKSRVAPLEKRSIPRLELCGALLAAELYEKVLASLRLNAETFFWVDSTTVLSWLQASPSKWNTFVANRVSKIQLTTQKCTWRHVAGLQNPADYISRGTTAEIILSSELWCNGPQWLHLEQDAWPMNQQEDDLPPECTNEMRKTITTFTAATALSFVDLYVSRFSNCQRLLEATAYF
ncbi:uncharacterized protein LOC129717128 [Wyeomyia smithii]|uniref:uncharacterized protein LOC129717128 n=1 Tax=Wyeomyia smithii TaxID=174621 RepID=UPI002467C0FB|nr:uncharacterized protein LOC129717128 [Wyeomyia smithii]